MNLTKASNQWATRPVDERYESLTEMFKAAWRYKRCHAASQDIKANTLTAVANDGDVLLSGSSGTLANFTHYSFGQLCTKVGAPAGYFREKLTHRPDIVASALTEGLRQCQDNLSILWNKDNDGMQARAFTSMKYGRVWNSDLINAMLPLTERGWVTPPARPAMDDPRARPATEADITRCGAGGGIGIKVGDMIAPAGLYMSDKDMFVCLMNNNRPIDAGNGTMLYRGCFVENSEVGDRCFRLTRFAFNGVCGNHIFWDCSNVEEISFVHKGDKVEGKALDSIRVEMTKYADESASEQESIIKSARIIELGKDKKEVVNRLYKDKIATQNVLEMAFDAAVQHPEDGGQVAPTSIWGMVQGLTRVSQLASHADARVNIDRAAGKVLAMAANN